MIESSALWLQKTKDTKMHTDTHFVVQWVCVCVLNHLLFFFNLIQI